jgi:hypothetical protein
MTMNQVHELLLKSCQLSLKYFFPGNCSARDLPKQLPIP